ncbi:hypothetical protein MAPG_04078 [Magnaporthiopsis poae ATCC 64411]|uniref:Uncharacterized protein n=1 Tax=Magnaporthiopsis poae (strain ATCC 64411 / 73-15) TaxID=644358 RepID=A0A0C4DVR7_MAGP6|nr:hypothetical protein MAPG_04078 [Magnaporthiopsis poae ATCC 64411]
MAAIAAPDRADPFSTAERGFGQPSQEVQAEPRQRPLQKLRRKTVLALGLGDPDAGADKAPLPARRRYLRSREGHTVQLVEADILNITRDHKHFKIWTPTLTEQPRFDDATAFGVTDAHVERLTRLEIARLSKLAAADTPGLFNSQGILGKTDNGGYEDLSGLADQLICNFQIIKHDNCCLCIEKGAPNKLPCHNRLADARRWLIMRYHNPSGQVEPRPPRVLSDARKNKDAYFLLADWVLGLTAWWLLRTAVSTYWQNQILAVLAQWSVKLKLISFDPERYAIQSLADSEELLRAARLNNPYNDPEMVVKVRGPKRNSETAITVLSEESDLVGSYYIIKSMLRERLESVLRIAFMVLQGEQTKENDAGTFEVCTFIYRTGLSRAPVLLHTDRIGSVESTIDVSHITYSHAAIDLLTANTQAIEQRDLPNGDGVDVDDDEDNECAEVVRDKGNDSQELTLRRIDDLVSVLVPLAFTSPFACGLVEELIASASLTASHTDPIYQFKPPPSNFEFGFAVSIPAWRRRRSMLDSGDDHDPEVVSLPNFPFQRPFRAGTDLANHRLTQRTTQQQQRLSVISTHSTTHSQGILSGVSSRPHCASPGGAGPSKLGEMSQIPKATQERSQSVLEEYRLHSKLVKSWVVGEESITVSCKLSSRLAIASAAILVVGGLVIGFTVGGRIEQVDPFNVANYMWFVAGFVLLVFKSRFVSDWPWHDFLRGHVVCRSVRDLAEVTGVS